MGIRLRVGRTFPTPFVWPTYEGRFEAARFSRIEVEIVACHHAAFAGIELQILGASEIGLWQYLVLADRLAGDNCVPAQAIALSGIDDDPKTQNSEGHAEELFTQLGQRTREVGPAAEIVDGFPPDATSIFRRKSI